MNLLEYVFRCPECEVDIPVVAWGEKDKVTYCHACELYFDLDGKYLRGSKEQIFDKLKKLLHRDVKKLKR